MRALHQRASAAEQGIKQIIAAGAICLAQIHGISSYRIVVMIQPERCTYSAISLLAIHREVLLTGRNLRTEDATVLIRCLL